MTPRERLLQTVDAVKIELQERLAEFNAQHKLVEAQRLEQRTCFDIEMILELGIAPALKITPVIYPAVVVGKHHRLYLIIYRRMPYWSLMNPMSPFHNLAPCTKVIARVKKHW